MILKCNIEGNTEAGDGTKAFCALASDLS